MDPISMYKASGLAESHRSKREASAWLANRLRWEQRLTDLRSNRRTTRPKAA
jgi:hypothetical protein